MLLILWLLDGDDVFGRHSWFDCFLYHADLVETQLILGDLISTQV